MKKNSIFKQAAFLAAAGILVRIIGLLYRSPLTKLIGSQGMGYYSTAYNVYALILLVSSYSIPTAISKLLSEKLAVNQYNNVKKILLCSFIYIVAVGGGAAIIAFVIAPYIVPDKAVSALRILCPTIFLSGLLGIFRGYFQAFKTTAFTGISQIIEQVFNACVSIGAAYLFIQPYLNNQSLVASHGATGSALGTGAGVLISLCYMLFMFKRTKQSYLNPPNIEAANPHTDSFKDIFKMISNIVTPIILATCVYNLISTIDMYMFYLVCGDGAKSISAFGAYGGEYIILQNVPVALASAMSTASIPNISSAWLFKDTAEVKKQIAQGTKVIMLILIPSAVGLSILAVQIIQAIFPQKETVVLASTLLTFGSPAIVFYGLSTYTNGLLQALGYSSIPLKNAIYALIIHCFITLFLLLATNLNIYSLLIGNCLYGLQLCFANQRALKHITTYYQEKLHTFIYPLISSAIMAFTVALCYYGLIKVIDRLIITLFIAIVIGVIIYFGTLLFLYKDNVEELSQIPYLQKIIKHK